MKLVAFVFFAFSSLSLSAKESLLIDLDIKIGELRAKPKILTLLNQAAQITQRDESGRGFDVDITPRPGESRDEKIFDIIIRDPLDKSGNSTSKSTIKVKENFPATLSTFDNKTGHKQIIELKYATIQQD